MTQYKVIVADRAKTMLGAYIKFLARVNPAAAREAKTKLLAVIRSQKDMPERFPFLDEAFVPRGKYRKLFVDDWCLVLCQIKGQTVFVDYLLDCRQDYSWLIR
ncbi:MAG: type II toxin-antitoxin system RelE/ParE family toxin [Oscillospiraceae bacterium]|jgi:plasmid stabilization system protein ParE|nr:type II toxin-antitoxin system RelE/ParE family toxin [Oscillospiraceae bacterium]